MKCIRAQEIFVGGSMTVGQQSTEKIKTTSKVRFHIYTNFGHLFQRTKLPSKVRRISLRALPVAAGLVVNADPCVALRLFRIATVGKLTETVKIVML